jgi:hypothetical protein
MEENSYKGGLFPFLIQKEEEVNDPINEKKGGLLNSRPKSN